MSRVLVARAPARIDFGGGWTDVPPYAAEQGGMVCNIAITRYATATASFGDLGSRSDQARAERPPLVAAALRRSGLAGADAFVHSTLPVGSGLGGSSAAGVALAGVLAALAGNPVGRDVLAERSRATEVEELGVAGGFQDHYAAAYGGALLLTFQDCVGVEQIGLTRAVCELLAQRALLIYTGESRMSSTTISAVLHAYAAREPRVCHALDRMKALAGDMASALRAGDVDALGTLIGEHWVHQRRLHPSITTPRIDAIMDIARRTGALGGKALGASGGGCVLIVSMEDREEELAEALAPFGERLAYEVDESGFQLLPGPADA